MKTFLKFLSIPVIVIAMGLGAAACGVGGGVSGKANKIESTAQGNDSLTFDQNQPPPHFPYSIYRKTLTEVQAIQALGSQTTSFFFNLGVQKPIFSCPSLGMPVPNTASLTNPNQAVWNSQGSNGVAGISLGQMDPNGVYTPSSSSGTNVLCLDSKGQPYIQYWEGNVDAVSGAATWDNASNQVVVTGQPTVPTCRKTGSGANLSTTCTK